MNVGEFFLDTNIVLYSLHSESTQKRKAVDELMTKAIKGLGGISFQVVQEFISVSMRKFVPVPPFAEIRSTVQDILLPLVKVFPGPNFYLDALDTQHITKFSWYDSLILQAAVDAHCKTIFTEDLQDGFQYRGVTIRYPFK